MCRLCTSVDVYLRMCASVCPLFLFSRIPGGLSVRFFVAEGHVFFVYFGGDEQVERTAVWRGCGNLRQA